MVVLADTSGLVAFLDKDDANHEAVVQAWQNLVERGCELVTNNYVLTETAAVCQRRFGLAVTRRFLEEVVPALVTHWVDQEVHERAASALLLAGRRDLSLVDCVCFDTMRSYGIRAALAFDQHFREQGFECIP